MMNLRKHVAGFALFSIIVGSAVFINAYLNVPTATISPVPVSEEETPQRSVEVSAPQVTYNVRQVSIDLVNKQSYTQLVLKLQPGQLPPENLWVTTVFLPHSVTNISSKNLMTTRQIRQPFARGDNMEYTVSSQCEWCGSVGGPNPGYFARVFVSTDSENLYPADFDTYDIRKATPVVVQVGRGITR